MRGLGGLLVGERQVLIVEDFVEHEEIRRKDKVRQLDSLALVNSISTANGISSKPMRGKKKTNMKNLLRTNQDILNWSYMHDPATSTHHNEQQQQQQQQQQKPQEKGDR